MSTPTNEGDAPSKKSLEALTGAFFRIRAANFAIRLQEDFKKIEEADSEDPFETLDSDEMNASLATARDNAEWWKSTVSANVQNVLQHLSSHSELYSALAPELGKEIEKLKDANDNPPEEGTLSNISDYLLALQEGLRTELYGNGTKDDPGDGSLIYTYNQLNEYQSKVDVDKRTFGKYDNAASNSETGLQHHIDDLKKTIDGQERAINNDIMMAAGASAASVAAVAGAGVILTAGAMLAPVTMGASVAVAIVAIPTLGVGGAGAVVYAGQDLVRTQLDLADNKVKLQEYHTELASLNSVFGGIKNLNLCLLSITKAMETIIANWQQMDNNISNSLTAVEAINKPGGDMSKWIKEEAEKLGEGETPNYKMMGIVLDAKMKAPQESWSKSAEIAKNMLAAIASSEMKELKEDNWKEVLKDHVKEKEKEEEE